jgi:hypothetical protein
MTDRSILTQVKVAAPCSADWDAMEGDDRARFCGQCKKNVYNLSAMTEKEAAALVRNTEGRLCVRYYRRTDGTMLTADCPVGADVKRRRTVRNLAVLASAGTALAAYRLSALQGAPMVPLPMVEATPMPHVTMGDVAEPPAPLMGAVAPPMSVMGKPTMGEAPEMGRMIKK